MVDVMGDAAKAFYPKKNFCHLLSYLIRHVSKKHTDKPHKMTEKRTNHIYHPVTADL
jgi:hypothetical protein